MRPLGPDPSAVREELRRVLTSPGFAQNERLSRFLRFVVERQLEDRGDEIKESVIGVEVFNRRADFDPKQDSIVRTEAARLRSRLTEYYAGEGCDDAIVIEVPKGGYAPLFNLVALARDLPSQPSRRRTWTMAIAAVCVIAIAAGAWWMLRGPRQSIAIAMLPLENLNRTPDTDYVADGLTDEIIRNLSIIEGLEVRSRTSSFAFKGKPLSAREAGKKLGADYLVEGSVLRSGSRLRIDAQLVRVRDDVLIWSRRFDPDSGDILAVQEEISTDVANSLRLHLGRGRRRYEISADAYDSYLRARAQWHDLSLGVREPGRLYEKTIDLYERAITQDSGFAPAYAGLATVYARRSVQFPLAHPSGELPKLKAAAETAIQLDPFLAEAHAALGSMYARRADWTQAEQCFRRAIEIDHQDSSLRSEYVFWVLAVQGRLNEAIAELETAERADPLSPMIRQQLAQVLADAGRYEEGAGYCERIRAPTESPRLECLASVRAAQGRPREAIDLLQRAPEAGSNPQMRGLLGYAYARSGRAAEAKEMAERSTFPNEQALIRAGLGDKDGTIEALDRMAELGAQRVGLYLNRPEFALLRGDLRSAELRRRLGLPELAAHAQ